VRPAVGGRFDRKEVAMGKGNKTRKKEVKKPKQDKNKAGKK
jgi:hypothetical protein